MSDYVNFPPQIKLMIILEDCPRAAIVFLKMWELRSGSRVCFKKKDIRKVFLISNTVLKNYLYDLEKAKLLTFKYMKETKDDADITVIIND